MSDATVIAALACGLAVAVAAPAAADLARADAAWARRSDGARAGSAAPEPVAAAVRAYEAALAAAPDDVEARWKLLRALWFEGEFATPARDAEKARFERASALADESLARIAARIGADPGALPDAALRQRLAAAGIEARDAAALHFWSAVAWGAWSRTHGLVDAVRRGVAARIHELATVAHRLDPELEQGGSLRLLGRLHATLPRVPFVSGFVDRAQAVPLAAETLRRWPEHPGNRFLLALTWLELAPERRDEAIALLGEVAGSAPRPAQHVEDAAVVTAARERLAAEQGG